MPHPEPKKPHPEVDAVEPATYLHAAQVDPLDPYRSRAVPIGPMFFFHYGVPVIVAVNAAYYLSVKLDGWWYDRWAVATAIVMLLVQQVADLVRVLRARSLTRFYSMIIATHVGRDDLTTKASSSALPATSPDHVLSEFAKRVGESGPIYGVDARIVDFNRAPSSDTASPPGLACVATGCVEFVDDETNVIPRPRDRVFVAAISSSNANEAARLAFLVGRSLGRQEGARREQQES